MRDVALMGWKSLHDQLNNQYSALSKAWGNSGIY